MPRLEIIITNPKIQFLTDDCIEGSKGWTLVSWGKLVRDYERFDVQIGPNTYDGFEMECKVSIEENTPENIKRFEELALIALKNSTSNQDKIPTTPCLGAIALPYSIENNIRWFEIVVIPPEDQFLRISALLERCRCRLQIETDLFANGLKYGDDPTGGDLRWIAEDTNVSLAEKIVMKFESFRAPDEPDSLPISTKQFKSFTDALLERLGHSYMAIDLSKSG